MMTFFSTDGHGFTLIYARALLVLAFIAEYFFARKRRGKTQTIFLTDYLSSHRPDRLNRLSYIATLVCASGVVQSLCEKEKQFKFAFRFS